MRTFSQEEVDKIFNALIAEYLPPVTKMKPNEIEKLEAFEKENYKKKFNIYLQVYVKPLEKLVTNLLDSANKEKYTYNVDNLSILERITLYGDILTHSGYTEDQLKSLVPKTKEEGEFIAKAIANGFEDSDILDNETRIAEAQNFLNSLGESENVSRRIA